MATTAYILGHDPGELDRLIAQARFFGDLTEEVLRRAGVGPGMRVLDVGCGTGDVSFLAARLVGPTGSVLGVDRSADFQIDFLLQLLGANALVAEILDVPDDGAFDDF